MATTPIFLPGGSHGQRSLMGYSPQGCKELDMTEMTEHTHTYTKKDLNDPDNHNGVISHLEPGILECKVKCLRKHHYEHSQWR